MPEPERNQFSGAEHIRALQTSRLLNPDITLRGLIQAAQKIPGLGDGSPNAWELVTRDFVYKGSLALKGGVILERDIAALQQANILNFDISLGEVLEMSQRIPGLGAESVVAWELISRDFVLRGAPALLARNAEVLR